MKKNAGSPVEKNREYETEIESVTSEGMGVGHIDGFCVFVKNAAPGDRLRIQIVKAKSSYAYGIIKGVISPSPVREEPICADFSKCGGCSLMHIKYDEQLKVKKQIIEDAFLRIGGEDVRVSEMIGSDIPLRYRNKMIFPVGIGKDGKTVCGFYRERSHDIIPLSDCYIGDEINKKIISAVLDHMKKYGISPYDEKNHTGTVRRIFTRKAYYTGEVMAVISVNGDCIKESALLVDNIAKISPDIKSVILNINKKKTNNVLGEENRLLFGKKTISDMLLGFRYEISPESFYQVNPKGTEKLYEKAMEYADITKNDIVMDLYCGIGTISLLAARRAQEVIGVEIVDEAIENAKVNAKNNGVRNVRFFAKSAEEIVPQLIENGEKPSVVILDPPRKGSDEITLAAIAAASPERIVYVSCNPATLARDVRFLAGFGYGIAKIAGVDMFPQTAHVECVVLMSRVDK